MLKKAFDKIQNPFMLKVLEISVNQSPYLNTVKAIYGKPVTNIKVSGKKLEATLLKLESRQTAISPPFIQYSA